MTSLLPYNLRDDSFTALEETVQTALKTDFKNFMTSIVDFIPSDILPYLAEMFSVKDEGYNLCADDNEKRDLIKSAVSIHKKKGTIGAVEDYLSKFGLNCEIWTDYGGIPHHFKISLSQEGGRSDIYEIYNKIIAGLNKCKQLRAKLDEVSFDCLVSKNWYISSAVLTGEIITVDFT